MSAYEQYGIAQEQIARAAALLRAGKLVAFPTETVYGLGANALDVDAVALIFKVKGRPNTSPIIVHVSNAEMVREVAAAWPEKARLLAEHFWPGPLTLVVPKTAAVPEIVTAGLTTVGIRMPAHPIALALIERAQVPIAAPSANRFTHVSPTAAEHVRRSLGNRVDFILDGGPSQVGIESTVLSLVEDFPVLLRPGSVSRRQIEELIGVTAIASHVSAGAHASPGMHPRHYSPRTWLVLVHDGQVPAAGEGAYLQVHRPAAGRVCEAIIMPDDPSQYAARLYSALHELDARGYDWIAVETPGPGVEWEAVLDRLRHAANAGT